METEYFIDENDFLNYQLYAASRSDMIRKKRIKNKVLVPVVYMAFAVLFIAMNNEYTAFFFAAVSVLWFFLFPLYERQRYVSYYRKYIRENYKERLGRKVMTRFENDFIYTYDNGNEGKIASTEVVEISELSLLILLKLKTGQSLIIPKNKLDKPEEIRTFMKEYARQLNVPFLDEISWRWK